MKVAMKQVSYLFYESGRPGSIEGGRDTKFVDGGWPTLSCGI